MFSALWSRMNDSSIIPNRIGMALVLFSGQSRADSAIKTLRRTKFYAFLSTLRPASEFIPRVAEGDENRFKFQIDIMPITYCAHIRINALQFETSRS